MEIKLTIRQSDWSEVLDSLKLYGEGMIVGSAEIDGVKYPNIGLRYRGQTSYTYQGKKNPFLIRLDHIHPEQNHQGYAALVLSNALRDPSYVREHMAFGIARQYMDAPMSGFCKLYINGEFIGLYTHIEPVDRDFLQRRYSDRWKTLYKCSPKTEKDLGPDHCRKGVFANLGYEDDPNCYAFNYTLKEGAGWADLIEMTRILEKEPQRIAEVLDVDAMLWMIAYNNVLANLSSYSGRHSSNYYLIQGQDGRFRPVVWDLNLAFGSFKNTGVGSDLNSRDMERMDPFLHQDNVMKPLIRTLLQDDLNKKIYVSHMRQIIQDHFRDNRFLQQARDLQRLIGPAVQDEKAPYYTKEEFGKSLDKTIGTRTKIPGLASFMEARATYLRKDDRLRAVAPEVVSVSLRQRARFAAESVDAFHFSVVAARQTRKVQLFYRFSAEESFRSIWLEATPHEGLEPGQEHFSGSVVPGEGHTAIEYYVLAENLAAVTFHPEQYRVSALRAKLEDLN